MLFRILLILLYSSFIIGDFLYSDFNQTLGLAFNGDATTTKCIQQLDKFITTPSNGTKEQLSQSSEEGGMQSKQTTTSESEFYMKNESSIKQESAFGHRSKTVRNLKSECSTRLRLTPSSRSKAGSVWYQKRIPVLKGFETTFSFQVIDHSIICSDHIDPTYALEHYRSCAVHGGDGLAFVIHSDENKSTALGGNGQELGFGGISNSLAVEFDMWTNVDTQGSDDFFHDHISIHSASTGINHSGSSTSLGYARIVDLADGDIHKVKIRYLPYVETEYLRSMTANKNLLPYIKDNGEGRRLGTLAVFIDEGIKDDSPILAIPINLSVLLDLPETMAYVGFTASTGDKWEKHDILSWEWCDSKKCHGDPAKSSHHEPGNENKTMVDNSESGMLIGSR